MLMDRKTERCRANRFAAARALAVCQIVLFAGVWLFFGQVLTQWPYTIALCAEIVAMIGTIGYAVYLSAR